MIPSQKNFNSNLKQQTQKALKAINQHQKFRQSNFITMTSFATQTNSLSNNTTNPIKTFQHQQRVTLQLLPNSLAYYKIYVNSKIDQKIIIRHFRGGPVQIYVFYDRISKQLDKASHHFVINNEIILKISRKFFDEAKCIYLIFKNNQNLSIFVFRMDLIRSKKNKNQIKTDKSIGSIDLQELNTSQQKLVRSRSSKIKSHKNINYQLHQFPTLKPGQKLKKIAQLKSLELQRKQASKKRIQNIQIYKEKNAEAQKVLVNCKKLFHTYQQLVKKEEERKKQIVLENAPMIYLMKFCLISSIFFNQRQKNMKRALIIRNYERRFLRKIRRSYKQTIRMEPQPKMRQLQVFSQLNSLISHSLYHINMKKTGAVIYDSLKNCAPGILINLSMNSASDYRRIVRGIQRKWKSRFQARTSMLMIYAQEQLKVILQTFPELKAVQKQYRQKNKGYEICIQYQKQTASKMMDLICAYENKLQQVQQYKRINKQLQQFNKTALKKKQKEYLEVPKKPAYPQFRFFRDMLFLKSMIRGQLEIQYRRFKKKNQNLSKQKKEQTSPRKNKSQNKKKK